MPRPDALPACSVDDKPSVIYTHDDELDLDVFMSCSVLSGEAAWRPILTMPGVVYDGPAVQTVAAAVNSGMPGVFVLRLPDDNTQFEIGALDIHTGQELRILSNAGVQFARASLAFTGLVLLLLLLASEWKQAQPHCSSISYTEPSLY